MSIFSLLPVEENLSFAVCSWGRLEKSYKTCTHQWWMKICRHISCVFRIETGLVIGSEPVCPGPPPFFLHMYRTNVGKEEKSRVERNEVTEMSRIQIINLWRWPQWTWWEATWGTWRAGWWPGAWANPSTRSHPPLPFP